MKGLFGYLQNKMYGPGIKGPTVEMFRTIVLGLIRSNDKMFSTWKAKLLPTIIVVNGRTVINRTVTLTNALLIQIIFL